MPIFGKAVELPKTLAELEQLLPELVAQAREEGKASVDLETVRKEEQDKSDKAKTAELDRVNGILVVALGEETASTIQKAIAAGITPEQMKTLGWKPAIADRETELKEKILTELKKSGADNPGSGAGDGGNQKDWETMVASYQAENKCTRTEAIKAIEDKYPGLRKEYLKRINPGKEVTNE